MALVGLPRVDRLHMADLTLPASHPRAAEGTCSVFAYVVHHPDGPVLVDTGVGAGNELIDRLYQPRTWDVVERLAEVGVDARDVVTVVLSHLHFDHCGQQTRLAAPVVVQADEVAAAALPRFTVPEWARVPADRLRTVTGDAELAEGVRLLHTPGHTPGHQSVLVEGGGERLLLVGQCAYTAAELAAGQVPVGDAHDPSWHPAANASVERLRALQPTVALFAHDASFFPLPAAPVDHRSP
ncbi:hypothetical protein BH18ACT1_BH18ACT1_16950 [soil metagenome]